MQSMYYELPLPKDIHAKDLRKFIIGQIAKKGEIIRWSIYDIVISGNKKILKINALVLNKILN
tara:strand:+ start:58 stop:246 length:189 start_codon:yes stop_codon:yes gene_type:complete